MVAPGPDPAQQRVAGHDPTRVEREHAQQLVLGDGERDRLAGHRHAAPVVVDGERAEDEGLGRLVAAKRHAEGA